MKYLVKIDHENKQIKGTTDEAQIFAGGADNAEYVSEQFATRFDSFEEATEAITMPHEYVVADTISSPSIQAIENLNEVVNNAINIFIRDGVYTKLTDSLNELVDQLNEALGKG